MTEFMIERIFNDINSLLDCLDDMGVPVNRLPPPEQKEINLAMTPRMFRQLRRMLYEFGDPTFIETEPLRFHDIPIRPITADMPEGQILVLSQDEHGDVKTMERWVYKGEGE